MDIKFSKQRYGYLRLSWQYFRRRWELFALALILLLATVVWLPEMVNRVYHGDQARSIVSGDNYAKLVDDYRKTLVQIIGGAFLLYTLYLTQRRTKAAEETLRSTQKTLEVTRETQITDRFTKAVGQLRSRGQSREEAEGNPVRRDFMRWSALQRTLNLRFHFVLGIKTVCRLNQATSAGLKSYLGTVLLTLCVKRFYLWRASP